jgi:hypothetical protein
MGITSGQRSKIAEMVKWVEIESWSEDKFDSPWVDGYFPNDTFIT